MIETLEALDRDLFLFLNGFHSESWDAIMVWISGKVSWIPLYVILLMPLWGRYKKKIVFPLVGIALLITLADQLSVHLFKNVIQRYRPCHNLDLIDLVHIVNGKCGGRFGFVSSHAANTFALASFLAVQFYNRHKWLAYALLLWAALVSYSRIYLGVHYPADIVGGACLGILIAFFVNSLMVRVMKLKSGKELV